MSSPVAHSLAGLAITMAWFGARSSAGTSRWQALWWMKGWLILGVIVANLPDLDYVPGFFVGDFNAFHHLATHSVAWVLITTLGIGFVIKALRPDVGWGILVWLGLLQTSHLVMDVVTEDGRPPYGIMLGWPFSSDSFTSPVSVFGAFSKKDWADLWQAHNLIPLIRELVIMVPWVALALWWLGRSPREQRMTERNIS